MELIPYIRNRKSLDFCGPGTKGRYDHFDSLSSENVDWNLIATHHFDILRVVLSIKAGLISASTLLRRPGTYSRERTAAIKPFCEIAT